LYKKILLAYDGSIEGRRALREGATIAQQCKAEIFLLAVVEVSAGTGIFEGSSAMSVTEEILDEGVQRLRTMDCSLTARLGVGEPGREIVAVAEEIGANLVVVGHRPDGPPARWWFGSVGTYLVKNLRCSVLVAQTEIGDEEFARLMTRPLRRRFARRKFSDSALTELV
jgi:nucleotide-binding universal stress UspA family protein